MLLQAQPSIILSPHPLTQGSQQLMSRQVALGSCAARRILHHESQTTQARKLLLLPAFACATRSATAAREWEGLRSSAFQSVAGHPALARALLDRPA